MSELEFEESTHTYRLDGKIIQSISQILRPLSERILSAIPDQDVVEAARARGVEAHASIDRLNKGLCDRYESNYTEAWAKFCDATGFTPTHSEYRTYHPSILFAATIDVLGTLPDGRQMLIDVKTGSKYKHLALQTAGQAMCLSAHGLCDRNVLRANVHLFEKDGEWTYKIDEHNDPGDFTALFNFIGWQRAKERYT